jgi:hypothetical protein
LIVRLILVSPARVGIVCPAVGKATDAVVAAASAGRREGAVVSAGSWDSIVAGNAEANRFGEARRAFGVSRAFSVGPEADARSAIWSLPITFV